MSDSTIPIPLTLEQAVDQLIGELDAENRAYLTSHSLNQCLGNWHHWGGMALRNDWGLWRHDHPLAKDLSARGFVHGDDRSGVIMSALWHKVNGKPHDIAAEAESNRQHWERAGVYPDGTPIPGAKPRNSWSMIVKDDGSIEIVDEDDDEENVEDSGHGQ